MDDDEREQIYARYPELGKREERIMRIAEVLTPDDRYALLMELKQIVDEFIMVRDN